MASLREEAGLREGTKHGMTPQGAEWMSDRLTRSIYKTNTMREAKVRMESSSYRGKGANAPLASLLAYSLEHES